MERIIWHPETLPEGMKPDRVHAVLVMRDGRVLLRYKGGNVRKVTGGHIDPEDVSMEAALAREILEEINCKIDRCDYIGYLEYLNDEEGVHEIWARMVARIVEILPPKPDPDRAGSWTYGRALMTVADAEKEVVEEGAFEVIMPKIMSAAMQKAEANGYFTEPKNTEKVTLNPEVHVEE